MISGLSAGILSSARFRPNDTWSPSNPSWAASDTAAGLAPSFRFQSVTPTRSFCPLATSKRELKPKATAERRKLRRVNWSTRNLPKNGVRRTLSASSSFYRGHILNEPLHNRAQDRRQGKRERQTGSRGDTKD